MKSTALLLWIFLVSGGSFANCAGLECPEARACCSSPAPAECCWLFDSDASSARTNDPIAESPRTQREDPSPGAYSVAAALTQVLHVLPGRWLTASVHPLPACLGAVSLRI